MVPWSWTLSTLYVSIRLPASIDVCIHPFIRSPRSFRTPNYTEQSTDTLTLHRYRVRSSTPYLLRRPRNPICQEITNHPFNQFSLAIDKRTVSKYGYITLTQSNWSGTFLAAGMFIAGHLRREVLMYGSRVISSPSHPNLHT